MAAIATDQLEVLEGEELRWLFVFALLAWQYPRIHSFLGSALTVFVYSHRAVSMAKSAAWWLTKAIAEVILLEAVGIADAVETIL